MVSLGDSAEAHGWWSELVVERELDARGPTRCGHEERLTEAFAGIGAECFHLGRIWSRVLPAFCLFFWKSRR